MTVQGLLGRALRRSDCLLAAAAGTLPLVALQAWKNWDPLSPESVLAQLLWIPVGIYCQLRVLDSLAKAETDPNLKAPGADAAAALPSAIGAELLFSLRFCVLAELCFLPALLALSVLGVEKPLKIGIILVLALLGALPLAGWAFKRLFALAVVLWQGLNAGQALAESARLAPWKKLKTFILPLLLWFGLAFLLQSAIEMAEGPAWLDFLLQPLAFLIAQAALLWGYLKLTL